MTTELPEKPRPTPVTVELFVTEREHAALFPPDAARVEPDSGAEVVRDFLLRVKRLFGKDVARLCTSQVVGLVIVPETPLRSRRYRWLN